MNLPKKYEGKDFDNFDSTKIPIGMMNTCTRFNSLEKKSLVMFGNLGTGKTHLMIAIAKKLSEIEYDEKSGTTVYRKTRRSKSFFIVADEFYQNLNDAIQLKKSKLELINEYLSTDLLLFDDLGKENFSPAKLENLYLLINRAYLDEKRMIITTNFTPEKLEAIDERIMSRLKEMANFIVFIGKDYRK